MRSIVLSFILLAVARGAFLSFDFKPNTPQSIPNPLGSAINLKCTIKSTDASDVMVGKMVSGTGSVNGQSVPAAGISFIVKNGDVVALSGSGNSEVSITNQGSNLVHADCDLALASSNSFLSFDFQPNAAQNIPNPLGSTINLKCTIKSSDASDVMFGKMISGTGSVNGQTVPASGISFTVKNGDVISLSASASSEVSITNQGSNLVHADCDLAVSRKPLRASNSFLSFDFQPNAAQSIPNPLGSTINLKCTISSTDSSDVMFGKMVSGTGSVNGQTVPASGILFTVKNGDVISLSASASSEVSIINQGSNLVHADCDLAASLASHYITLKSVHEIMKNGGLTDLGTFDFLPNTPQSITNPLLWSISASCALTTTDASDVLKGEMSGGSGTINGQDVPADGMSITVKTGDTMAITATAFAGVQITNVGTNTVHAQCGLTQKSSLTDQKLVQMVTYLLDKLNDLGHYDFEPNVAQTISNPLLWEISATCTLTATDDSDILDGRMLSGEGSFNGTTLPDSGLQVTVKNGDTLAITASGEAEVSITNLGKSNIHADCSLASLKQIEDLLHTFNKRNAKHGKKGKHGKHHKGWKAVLVKFLKWRDFE